MFQPVIPIAGLGGWRFLQATYDSQLNSFGQSAQIQNDREYFMEKFSKSLPVEDFLGDRRLMRIALTAFDLEGEEWKRGFIAKVLNEAADPDSTFLPRLNNPEYSSFAEAFAPRGGRIELSASQAGELGDRFVAASFRSAVGEVDNSLRMSLFYQSKIGELAGSGASESAVLYRLLGSVPMRTVLERALNLPADVRRLPIERQADLLKDRLQSVLQISDVKDLSQDETVQRVIDRFQALESVAQGSALSTSGSNALTLLRGGLGGISSQNLFLSNL